MGHRNLLATTFIENCLFLSLSISTYANKCRSGSWIPSKSALHDSQSAFLQRFQKVLVVLSLFDIIVLCLMKVTISFLFNFQKL